MKELDLEISTPKDEECVENERMTSPLDLSSPLGIFHTYLLSALAVY